MDQDQANNVQSQNVDDIIDQFKLKLIDELGFGDLSGIEKKEIEDKISQLISNRIINLILIYLPEEKSGEMSELVDGGDQNKIIDFIKTNVPGIEEKLANELMVLREELITKAK